MRSSQRHIDAIYCASRGCHQPGGIRLDLSDEDRATGR